MGPAWEKLGRIVQRRIFGIPECGDVVFQGPRDQIVLHEHGESGRVGAQVGELERRRSPEEKDSSGGSRGAKSKNQGRKGGGNRGEKGF